METILTIYVLGCLAVSSALMAWFGSGLPIHVLYMLKRVGYAKGSDMWNTLGEWTSTWDDFSVAAAAYMPPFIGELITCPVCLSFHISFWLALAIWVFAPVPFVFVIAATCTWPILSNALKSLVVK